MSGTLVLEPNFEDPDGFYAALIDAHRGLDSAGSEALNARLVLILANQVGRQDALLEALALARRSLPVVRVADAPSGPAPASPATR